MTTENMYCAGTTPALIHARRHLSEAGFRIIDSPEQNVMHLLLDVPSFQPGIWTDSKFDTLLSSLPEDIVVWGGNLFHPALHSYKVVDLLQDECYLQENAHITADCTIPIAEAVLRCPWPEASALIIGWGRIGKSLSIKLKHLGCRVTISSQNDTHRSEANAQGFRVIEAPDNTQMYRLIVNTAPAHVLTAPDDTSTVLLDLASIKGITGNNVIQARGLPGKLAPQRSGKLIADTILRLSREVCR